MVVKGYAQKEGIDYNEISLIVKHTSIRMLLAIVAQFDLELEQLDVKKAFLYKLEERIYIKQPEGYIQEGQEVFSRSPSMDLSSLPGSGTTVQLFHVQGRIHPM